ncbi:MAG TPA: hypothetical protein VIU62_17445 [Chloroflexota bacterium]
MTMDLEALRAIGPHESLQITPSMPVDEFTGDLVTDPGIPSAAGFPTLNPHDRDTMGDMKLVLLFPGQWWGDRPRMELFAKELEYGALTPMSPYGITSYRFAGAFDISPLSGQLSVSQVEAALAAAIGQNGVPAADRSTLFALMMPQSVTFDYAAGASSCAQFCGIHLSTAGAIYSVETWTGCQGCNLGDPFAGATAVLFHEVGEAGTNPRGRGWWSDQTGEECGDPVGIRWVFRKYGPWDVQGLLTNEHGNTLGDYVVPAVPVPNPNPAPDPLLVDWEWIAEVAAWAQRTDVLPELRAAEAAVVVARLQLIYPAGGSG